MVVAMPEGIQHPDGRDALAYAYQGGTLHAVLYTKRMVRWFEDAGGCVVTRTPHGEKVLGP